MNGQMKLLLQRLLVIMGILLASTAVRAQTLSYLLDNAQQTQTNPGERFKTLRFSIYLDPINTNWIALNTAPAETSIDDESVLGEMTPGNQGIDDLVIVTLIDPYGEQSPSFILDQNDIDGISFGPQSAIFGKVETTPRILRTNRSGDPLFFSEGGVATDFIRNAGIGYYTLELVFMNSYGDTAGYPNIYLLMNVTEKFEKKPLVMHSENSERAIGLLHPVAGVGGSFFSNNGTPPPISRVQLEEGDTRDVGGFPPPSQTTTTPENPFPPLPDDPPSPVIPEPGTLALVAIGLAGLINLKRKPRDWDSE